MTAASALPSPEQICPAPGLLRIFGDARFHADGELLALAFGSDGNLWSVEDPGILRHWDKTGRQLEYRFLSDLETLWSFSKDARFLASASDDLSLWETATGRLLRVIAQPSWVTAIAFRGDSTLVATGHDDGIVRLWEGGSGRLVRELANHDRAISALAFSPEGGRLAGASEDKSISIWATETDQLLGSHKGHTDRIQALAWDPKGERLVSGGWDTTARVWDTATFEPLILLNAHATQLTALDFSPNGQLLACSDSLETIFIWDFTTYRIRKRLQGARGQISCLAFAPDGRYVASGGSERVIYCADLEQGEPGRTGSHSSIDLSGFRRSGTGMALSPDGTRVATASDATLVVWDTLTGQSLLQFEGEASFDSLAFSPDGHWLAGGGADASIRLWEAANGQLRTHFQDTENPQPVSSLAFSPGSAILASASAVGTEVLLWNVAGGVPELLIPDALDGCTIESLAFHPQGNLLAVGGIDWLATGGSNGAVSIWNLSERCETATFEGGVTCLVFHPTGHWLAAAALDKSICIWDLKGRRLTAELVGHQETVTSVAYSPDGRWLASGGDDRILCLWDTATGKLAARAELNTQIKSLTFSPSARHLYTGNSNRTCYQFEVERLVAQGV